MRLPIVTIIILLSLSFLVDWRIMSVIRHRVKCRKGEWIYAIVNGVVFYGALIAALCIPHRTGSEEQLLVVMWLLFSVVTLLISKLFFVVVDFFSLIPKLWGGKRCRTISIVAYIVGATVFCLMWWGALVNRFNIDVKRVDVEVAGLPASFEGLKIVQFSDLHIGTFGHDKKFVAELVDSINTLAPDVVVFTGDIVNRKSKELLPFVDELKRLHAPLGVYSILGNHDYGDYVNWDSAEEKTANFDELIKLQERCGWRVLRDESVYLVKYSDSIAVTGVENIGDPPFHCYGNLKEAMPEKGVAEPWVLLSHNPVHWDNEVLKQNADSLPYALTLSGHTHAMQIELFGLTPAAFRYDRWGGMYENSSDDRKLYVNIGSGTVGMPMRVGATPEITLLTLHGKK